MMMNLTEKKCSPCEGKIEPFDQKRSEEYIEQTPGWVLNAQGKGISRDYVTKNFVAAVEFINKVKDVAEADDHHPDIHLTGYRKLRIDLSTHAIGGLSLNDFILAAKINELPVELKA